MSILLFLFIAIFFQNPVFEAPFKATITDQGEVITVIKEDSNHLIMEGQNEDEMLEYKMDGDNDIYMKNPDNGEWENINEMGYGFIVTEDSLIGEEYTLKYEVTADKIIIYPPEEEQDDEPYIVEYEIIKENEPANNLIY